MPRFKTSYAPFHLGEGPIDVHAIGTFEMDPLARQGWFILSVGSRIADAWLPAAQLLHADGQDAAAVLARQAPHLVLVDIDAWSEALGQQLQALGQHGPELVVVADAGQADAVGLVLQHRIAGFLDPDAEPAAGRALLHAILQNLEPSGHVADLGMGRDIPDPLELLRRDAERVALALAELASERTTDAPVPRPVTAARIRAHIKARRLRERFFGPDLFADPAWDMLLDLTAARLDRKPVSVSSLCIAAAVPTTTALRWIKQMIDRGLLLRQPDPHDARRAFIALSDPTAAAMERCLDAVMNLPGQ